MSFPFITTKYTHEIVSLREVKQWLRMDIEGYDEEDEVIEKLIKEAVSSVEQECGFTLGISDYQWNCDSRPCNFGDIGWITEITAITYTEDIDPVAYTTDDYRLIRTGKRDSKIKWSKSITVSRSFEHTLTFKAGFAEGDIPDDLITAIRARIGELFENRKDGVSEKRTLSDKILLRYKNAYAG